MLKESQSDYWNKYYSKNQAPQEPSSFALWVSNLMSVDDVVLDIGCGNGRDTFFLSQHCQKVSGIDRSDEAINANNGKIKSELNISFHKCDVENHEELQAIMLEGKYNVVYSRFFLHSISDLVCSKLLSDSLMMMPSGGCVYLEYRTDRDPLMKAGQILSESERVTDHYRRFINHRSFLNQIQKIGWLIKFEQEDFGLAVYNDQDPCVGRLVLERP